jgi:hypothetical protein
MADILVSPDPPKEGWSWMKFFSGFFNGLNTAKALVTTFHQILIAVIIGAVIFCGVLLYKHFHKPKVAPAPMCVTTNNGEMHSSTDDNKRKIGLINLF